MKVLPVVHSEPHQYWVFGSLQFPDPNEQNKKCFLIFAKVNGGSSWHFRQCWHHGTSAARLLSCNCSRWWQMCAMTYQENSHSYIFSSDCNVKYKSEQECFGHVQASALSWLDGQKQQNHKLKYIMDDILGVYASRSNNQNKPPTSSLRRNFPEVCHSCVGYIFTTVFFQPNIQETSPLVYAAE